MRFARPTLLAAPALLALLLAPGCGGGGGYGGSSPAASGTITGAALDAQVKGGMVRFMGMVGNIDSSFVYLLVPGTTLTPHVTVAADTAPGAQPNAVTYSGTYDGNRDGFDESTVTGGAAFAIDPDAGWNGVNGQGTIDVAIPVIGHLYHADVAYSIDSTTRTLSGSGRFTDPMSGTTTTLTVASATPLVVQPADDAAGIASNACGYNIAGAMRVDVAAGSGTLTSTWSFTTSSPSVAVHGTTFTDVYGQVSALPDSTVDLRCAASGSVNDWAAVFDQRWACLPRETGQARLTLAVNGASAVTITDEDPPGSGIAKTYAATLVAGNPHVLRGFFIGGAVGNRYREDFNWTLNASGSAFAQVSRYMYIEGPGVGTGGVCAASARRLP